MRETRRSYCRLCMQSCAVEVDLEDGRLVDVRGDKEDPVFRGFVCVKGRNQPRFFNSPDRLLHSLKRQPDGRYAPIEIGQAMDEIAAKLKVIIDRAGPDAVATYMSTNSVYSSSLNVLMSMAFCSAIGSSWFLTPLTIDQGGKLTAEAFHGAWDAPLQNGHDADAVMLIGLNPLISFAGFPVGNPGKWLGESLTRGMQLIVIDPRRTDVAKRAQLHIQPKPAHDIAILAAIIHVIIDEGLYDRDFVAEEAEGLDALRRGVAQFTPAAVAEMAGIDVAEIVSAARIYAGAKKAYVMAGTGANMAQYGTLLEYLILCLTTLCGRYQRAGDEVTNPGALSPFRPFKAQANPPFPARDESKKLRVRGFTGTCAGHPVMAVADEILLEGEGQLRALISCGGNPVAAWPDQQKTVAAMEKLELLVQVDPFMSQTARYADYVIAPKISFEMPSVLLHHDQRGMMGLFGLTHAYGKHTAAVVDPPKGSDVIADWAFFYGLAQRLGLQDKLNYFGARVPAGDGVSAPSADQLLEMMCAGSRIPLADVEALGRGELYPEPRVKVMPKDAGWPGRLQIGHPEMMEELSRRFDQSVTDLWYEPEGYPFRLVTRRMMHVHNSAYNVDAIHGREAFNPLFVHPADLEELEAASGDVLRVISPYASLKAIIRADDSLRPGVVAMSHNFGGTANDGGKVSAIGSNVNQLIDGGAVFDPYTGMPKMSAIPIRLERASD
jgi:anaerobic selenocysteine-containing dehydrogenase